ncbi:hypothetical protein MMC21_001949 [Puttea exsequens]|nr:hypothetical protein [Puttea exsequens]
MNAYEERLLKVEREKWSKETPANASSPEIEETKQQQNFSSTLVSFTTLDVFTVTRYRGNQLAIVHGTLGQPLPDANILSQSMKQEIAHEFNFAETVFLHDPHPISGQRQLDIFTLKEELPFAGHPVIGTICYVCQSVDPPLEAITLNCKSGPIVGRYDPTKGYAEAELPCEYRLHQRRVGARPLLTSTYLSKTSIMVEKSEATTAIVMSEFPIASIVRGLTFVLVELPTVTQHLQHLDSEQTVNLSSIKLDQGWENSFIATYFYCITEPSESRTTRIRTRMLEAGFGEDPATGSAASTLSCFLALKDGKPHKTYHYSFTQGVEMGRASEIRVKVRLDGSGRGIGRVVLAGRAVWVSEGKMSVG